MEKRLYAFVPYQLTGIQKGIQMQHALTEYSRVFWENEDFIDWRRNWKTTIVLDGGSTNEGTSSSKYNPFLSEKGTMQNILTKLIENDIKVEGFWEPDLNNTLTAFVFIAEEPCFNHEDFPFFENWILKEMPTQPFNLVEFMSRKDKTFSFEEYENFFGEIFQKWVDEVGGRKNVFLKYFLINKKLATN